jgi:hypothetical protein
MQAHFNFHFIDEHRETPKVLPLGSATPPTYKQYSQENNQVKYDSKENFIEDNYDVDDCSAQEYEIMKVCAILISIHEVRKFVEFEMRAFP